MKLAKDRRVRVWKTALIGVFLLGASLFLVAQGYPDAPNPPRLVNDFAGMLSSSENQQLENKLVAYDDSASTQIAIVIVNSLNGQEKAEYATGLAHKWGVGRKGKDNGVLILVSKSDHQLFIATGRNVEEYLPDATCEQIIENKIKPAFRASHYYTGLDDATTEMIARLSGTFVNDDKGAGNSGGFAPLFLVIVFIIVIIIISFINRGNNGTTFSRGGWGVGPFIGGFGGGGGGSDSGGFGGFGGGSFGGGGAGGSW